MSPPLWGLTAGAVLSVLIGLLLPGGAGVALLIPLMAVVFYPLGAFIGWIAGRVLSNSAKDTTARR